MEKQFWEVPAQTGKIGGHSVNAVHQAIGPRAPRNTRALCLAAAARLRLRGMERAATGARGASWKNRRTAECERKNLKEGCRT
jgi:hypothetical protein